MTRGRKSLSDPPTEWKVSLPSSVAAQVELRLVDPLTGRPRHGARAKLITRLLRGWLNTETGPQGTATPAPKEPTE